MRQREGGTMQQFQSTIVFSCPCCGSVVRAHVDVPEPDWSQVESASDVASEGQTTVVCSHCKWEFEATVQLDPSNCLVTLDDYPDTNVVADMAFFTPPEEDEWESLDIPSSPYEHFTDAYHHLGHLLTQVNDQGGEIHIPLASRSVLNRMVFTQQIGALEAYLGDTLKNGVLGSSAATELMLEGDIDLKKMTIPLAAIARNPMVVHDTVRHHLSSLIYHNLAKVEKLYRIAFGISIWPDKDVAKKLFVAVKERHDCVHRNGKDKDGNSLTQITRDYVNDILDTTLSMVIHIEGGLGRDRTGHLPAGRSEPPPF
jgi:hypothetical protein